VSKRRGSGITEAPAPVATRAPTEEPRSAGLRNDVTQAVEPRSLQEKLRQVRECRNITLPCPPNLRTSFRKRDGSEVPLVLRPYQKQMVVHLVNMDRFVVGDDCGLGKTLESIAALCHLWTKDPNTKALVLTKKSSIAQWQGEFDKFTRGIEVLAATGTPTQRGKAQALWEAAAGPTVLIQGYQSAQKDFSALSALSGFILILDDASVVKNPETKVHQACRELADEASRCWGLTATLIKNNLMEGYGIYRVVQPNLFPMSADFFMETFCIVEMRRVSKKKEIPKIVGYHRSSIMQFREMITDYYLGRPKHVVAEDLPVLTYRTIPVSLTKFQRDAYKSTLAGLANFGDGKEDRATNKLTSLVYCQEIVNHPALMGYPDQGSEKLDALVDIVTDGGDLQDEKVIVFTRFKDMVDVAMNVLTAAGVTCVRITGDEDERQRAAAQEAFQDPEDPTRIIFITMAGGDAINLQAAKAIVFYETPWSAGDYLQIIGRMIRLGSEHENCLAVHLVATGTIDEHVQRVVQDKMVLIEEVLGERVKTDRNEDAFFKAESDVNVIFDALVSDARGGKK